MQFRGLHTDKRFTAELQLHRNTEAWGPSKLHLVPLCYDNTPSFLFTTCLLPFPTLAVNKRLSAFFLPSPSSISNGAAIYHSTANKVAVILVLFYVECTLEIFHLLAESLRNVSSVRIHLFPSLLPCIASIIQDMYNHSQIFCRVLWASVSHWVILLSDKYLNLKKNIKAKIDSLKVTDPWRNVGE